MGAEGRGRRQALRASLAPSGPQASHNPGSMERLGSLWVRTSQNLWSFLGIVILPYVFIILKAFWVFTRWPQGHLPFTSSTKPPWMSNGFGYLSMGETAAAHLWKVLKHTKPNQTLRDHLHLLKSCKSKNWGDLGDCEPLSPTSTSKNKPVSPRRPKWRRVRWRVSPSPLETSFGPHAAARQAPPCHAGVCFRLLPKLASKS